MILYIYIIYETCLLMKYQYIVIAKDICDYNEGSL